MRFFYAFIFLFLSVVTQAQTAKTLYHQAKIYYNSHEDIQFLIENGVAIDHVHNHKKSSFISSVFSEKELKKAQQLGFKVDILKYDMQAFAVNQNNPKHKDYVGKSYVKNATCSTSSGGTTYTTPSNYDVKPANSFGGFYTYNEVLQELDQMVNLYPNLITVRADLKDPADENRLKTQEGRFLQWVKISDNPNTNEPAEPQMLYTAIHHAREPGSLQQLIFYMWYLLENYGTNSQVKSILDNTELYFIPVVNPDGYIYNETTNPQGGGLWRKNRRDNGDGTFGVDLNRNYSYITPQGNEVFGGLGTSSNTSNDVYHGTAPFSEPETSAVRYFVENHNFKLALNSHTSGDLLLFPFGYASNRPTPDNNIYEAISSLMVQENNFSNYISSNLYPAAGDSDDFMYGMLTTENGGTRDKVFAMTPEIGSSFWPAASGIEDLCKSMIFLNLTAAELVNNKGKITDTSENIIANQSTAFTYSLQYLGLTNASDFTVSILPVSANIVSVGQPITHTSLPVLQSVDGSIDISLTGVSNGDLVEFDVLVDNGTYTETTRVQKIFGNSSLLVDDNANDLSGWTTSSWGISTTEYVSASGSITDSPNGNYGNSANTTIQITDPIDLDNAAIATMSYNAKWSIESDYDYVQIQVSTDNGANWIPQCATSTVTGGNNQNGATGEPVYEGTKDWTLETVSLNDYLNETILVRFVLISDGSEIRDGFYFDDFKVEVALNESLSTDQLNTVSFTIYPNPVKDILKIKANNTLDVMQVTVYNLQGQLVSTYKNVISNEGLSLENLSTGLYLVKVTSNAKSQSFKVVKM